MSEAVFGRQGVSPLAARGTKKPADARVTSVWVIMGESKVKLFVFVTSERSSVMSSRCIEALSCLLSCFCLKPASERAGDARVRRLNEHDKRRHGIWGVQKHTEGCRFRISRARSNSKIE